MVNMRLHYNIVLQPEPEGGFTVTVPALPGCITYGKNLVEAKRMAFDAIMGYITSLQNHKEPIPSDNDRRYKIAPQGQSNGGINLHKAAS